MRDLEGALHIDGEIDGILETEHEISIGDQGTVSGLVRAKNIVVSGVLEGKVVCESIDILSTGKLMGEVVCGEMMIEAGGKFIGESRELTEGGLIVSFPEAEEKTFYEPTDEVLEAKKVVEHKKQQSQPAPSEDVLQEAGR
ncbi:polymer-forming cytoskeletal protein [Thiomicrospira sp. WB1]|uniref:bactofilin family protein n=1 Tax=Thiomicrospira sp. WB1 TaxID=1685380 RepID=UPI000749AB3F|nr:polymer-forming cytoskeletal protein [Thiomicrospira sp. WB1]KUJ71818.1 hypothetical protein AVO41_04980 [Thiomicrospira sp. WB1]